MEIRHIPDAEWSAIPMIDTEEYIGFYFMSKAYKAIEAWFGGDGRRHAEKEDNVCPVGRGEDGGGSCLYGPKRDGHPDKETTMPTDRLYALLVADGFCETKDGTCMTISMPDMASAKTYVQILSDKLKKQ